MDSGLVNSKLLLLNFLIMITLVILENVNFLKENTLRYLGIRVHGISKLLSKLKMQKDGHIERK